MILNRRRFLKGLGGASLALPALGMFASKGAAQSMPSAPKRAVFMWTPNGFNVSTFYPRTRHNGSAFGPLTADAFAARPLDTSTATTNGVPRAIFRHPEWGLRNLSAFRDRFSIVRGLRNSREGFINLVNGGDHGMNTACRLTAAGISSTSGYALGRSIDYAIAARINPPGANTPLVLHVGRNTDARNGGPASFISYRGPEDPDPGINNPWVAYRDLLNIAPGTPAEDLLLRRKRRAADLVRDELAQIQSAAARGSRDRRLLTEWLGLLEATEDDMQNIGPTCSPAARDAVLTEAQARAYEGWSNEQLAEYGEYAAIGQAMIKIAALSLLCDRTRVVTLQWSNGAGGPTFGSMGLSSSSAGPGTWHPGERHHELSHRNGSEGAEPGFLPDVERNLSWIDQWYGDRYRDLLQLLDQFGILDDSLVVWVPEFGDGRTHHYMEITAVIAGTAGGRLRTGEMFDCSANGNWDARLDTETNGPRIGPPANPANVYNLDIGGKNGATSHNKLLTTVFNSVLPRDANGAPINPIARFPETNTADPHNLLENGELTQILA